jgi:protease I
MANAKLTPNETAEVDAQHDNHHAQQPYASELDDRELEQAHKEKRPVDPDPENLARREPQAQSRVESSQILKERKMANQLEGLRIAVLATDGFEQVELTEPVKGLKAQGALVEVVSLKAGKIQGYHHDEKGEKIAVDKTLDQVNPGDYDALVLPGGVQNPDSLRVQPQAVAFVAAFVKAGKPISAVCHGPWTLIDANGVKGRKMTSWPSLRADLTNAGAHWVDQEVVVDGPLVTSRKPEDLPAFVARTVEVLAATRRLAAE